MDFLAYAILILTAMGILAMLPFAMVSGVLMSFRLAKDEIKKFKERSKERENNG